jgi:hypothetical protein
MILKNILARKNIAKILALFAQTTYCLLVFVKKILSLYCLVFFRKTPFFRRKVAKSQKIEILTLTPVPKLTRDFIHRHQSGGNFCPHVRRRSPALEWDIIQFSKNISVAFFRNTLHTYLCVKTCNTVQL